MKLRFLFLFISSILFQSCTENKRFIDKTLAIKELPTIGTGTSVYPMLFASKDRLFMSWTEKINDTISSLHYSSLVDTTWAGPQKIAQGSHWFVNWADFPAVAENNGHLLLHFLEKSADRTYTYDIKMKSTAIESATSSKAFTLHNDQTESEHGFVSMIPAANDSFFVSWLDGRNTNGGHHDHGSAGAMTLRCAYVNANGNITDEVELDARTCDCCQTSVAMTQNGPVVVYRDRDEDEIRDISIRRFQDSTWTAPKRIFADNWKISGCPVNGPKVASFSNNLAVFWYTAANNKPQVKLILSQNNGSSFGEPILIDQGTTIGRVDLDFINKDSMLLTWVNADGNQAKIMCAKVDSNGTIGDPFVVSNLDPSRASGFPQLEIYNSRAYFAWTEVSETNSKVKTVYIDLDNL